MVSPQTGWSLGNCEHGWAKDSAGKQRLCTYIYISIYIYIYVSIYMGRRSAVFVLLQRPNHRPFIIWLHPRRPLRSRRTGENVVDGITQKRKPICSSKAPLFGTTGDLPRMDRCTYRDPDFHWAILSGTADAAAQNQKSRPQLQFRRQNAEEMFRFRACFRRLRLGRQWGHHHLGSVGPAQEVLAPRRGHVCEP